jgi:hypothetical protein
MDVVDDRKRRKRVKPKTGTSGRVTEKGSARYTPPVPIEYKQPSKIVPFIMFGFFGLGVILILLNYLPGSPLLPGDRNNWNLLIGLGLICLGFGAATRLR